MAKGRNHSKDHHHHERFLGGFGDAQGHVAGGDISEEDVWYAEDACASGDGGSVSGGEEGLYARGVAAAQIRRWVKVERPAVGGLSLAFEGGSGGAGESSSRRVVQRLRNVDASAAARGREHRAAPSSAPVSVPDWPRILRVESADSLHLHAGYDDDDGEWVPPHEYLAREYAKSGRSMTNSVVEGIGRTLKGRDLSRVRNAVWSQTGFFG
ncbi:unnamed protein product [Spirodela intermedia]|uniref:Uncharacterized protein n=2 Tax=Spirodela intermedia TaxID=51605 RepID=A0A7I8IM38_SPIIN|nr:unnamed protein product [Spirodela intermedia]CAA6658214.1 unnamed protein product [Spirodela intermedia]CAA7394400.1 unnamed protein product [Spirodela intermedia]